MFTKLLFISLLFLPTIKTTNNSPNYIKTWAELKSAITQAKDNESIFVDDIDFTSHTDGLYSEFERIAINKSLTINGKSGGSVLKHASFAINGKSTYQDQLKISFYNIKFVEYEESNKSIKGSDWDIDPSASEEMPTKCQFASSFNGNVLANYENCDFVGYMDIDGAVMHADYSTTPESKLLLNLKNCSFSNNAALHSGGCMRFNGNEKNVSININECKFDNNISGIVSSSGYGGGAIYGDQLEVNIQNTAFTNNIANYLYEGLTATQDSTSGGAIYLTNSLLNVKKSSFTANKASLGGAVRANNSNVNFNSCLFDANRVEAANDTGDDKGKYSNKEMGAAYYQTGFGGYKTVFDNCQISNNSSKNIYGGIYVYKPLSDSMAANELEISSSIYFNNISETTTFVYDGDEDEDIFAYSSYHVKGSAIIDDIFERYYPKYEIPSNENNYCYFASLNKAKEDNVIVDNVYNPASDKVNLKLSLSNIDVEEGTVVLGTPYVGNSLADQINVKLLKDKKLFKELSFENNTAIKVENLDNEAMRNFVSWKLENGSDFKQDQKYLAFKDANTIVLTSKFEYSSTFYFLVIGLPIIVVLIACLIVFLLLFRKHIIKCREMKRAIFSEDEIKTLLSKDFGLTPKEKDVLAHLLKRTPRKDISKALYVSEATIKTHIYHIYQKLDVKSRSDFIKKMHKALE